MKALFRKWFYRVAAVQFLVTAVTGMVLYFRPLDDRAGAFSKTAKEWLVMAHNGEWLTYVLFENRYVSGVAIGAVLSALVIRFAWKVLRGRLPSLVEGGEDR